MAKDGEHVSLKDPFDRSIALAFDLVIAGQLNVWDVDLVKFSQLYLQRAKEQKIDYVVGRADYSDNARGAIVGDRDGFLKLLFRRRDMRLLGAHVMGEQATELVHVGLMTMLRDGGAVDLQRACFNVPTLSSLYKDAAYRAQIARDLPDVKLRRIARRAQRAGAK